MRFSPIDRRRMTLPARYGRPLANRTGVGQQPAPIFLLTGPPFAVDRNRRLHDKGVAVKGHWQVKTFLPLVRLCGTLALSCKSSSPYRFWGWHWSSSRSPRHSQRTPIHGRSTQLASFSATGCEADEPRLYQFLDVLGNFHLPNAVYSMAFIPSGNEKCLSPICLPSSGWPRVRALSSCPVGSPMR